VPRRRDLEPPQAPVARHDNPQHRQQGRGLGQRQRTPQLHQAALRQFGQRLRHPGDHTRGGPSRPANRLEHITAHRQRTSQNFIWLVFVLTPSPPPSSTDSYPR
jgi:hypothetical protein